ncbi:MAG: SDR family oxidoreductase, partial [Pseudomonadota bacterium]
AAAAESFAADGAKLVLTDYDQAPLDRFAADLSAKTGADVAALAGDIAEEATSAAWVALALERFGGIDGAFNNAGIEHPMLRFQDIPAEMAKRVMDVDAMGVLFAMKHQLAAMVPQFKESGRTGAILNTASAAGVAGAPRLGAYAGAKHAVVGMSATAAIEVARSGVRVNALCPAFVRTRMVMQSLAEDLGGADNAMEKLTRFIPMGRIGEVAEVVPAIRFALHPANGFFTGQTIQLDGGLNA